MDIKNINGEYIKLGKTSITVKKEEDIKKNKRCNYKLYHNYKRLSKDNYGTTPEIVKI